MKLFLALLFIVGISVPAKATLKVDTVRFCATYDFTSSTLTPEYEAKLGSTDSSELDVPFRVNHSITGAQKTAITNFLTQLRATAKTQKNVP